MTGIRRAQSQPRLSPSLSLALCVATLFAASARAGGGGDCPITERAGLPIGIADRIRIDIGDSVDAGEVEAAIDLWAACPGYARSFPRLVTTGDADFSVRLRIERRWPGPSRCAYLGNNEIVVYVVARDALGFEHGCLNHPEIIAHEIGHLLALADAGSERQCDRFVMAPVHTGQLDRGKTLSRTVQPEECAMAERRWMTWSEIDGESTSIASRPAAARAEASP